MGREQQQEITVAAPTGGWNRRDALGTMDQNDAIVMDNFISTGGFVKTRAGFKLAVDTEFAYKTNSPVETISSYIYGDFNELVFVRRNNESTGLVGIYATIPNVESPEKSFKNISPAQNQYQGMFKDLMFQGRLWFVSRGKGEDPLLGAYSGPLNYDGTYFKPATFWRGELVLETFHENWVHGIAAYKKRLYMIEDGTMLLWFTERAGNIQGAVDCIDLSDYATKGGSLVAIEEWTRTGADSLSSVLFVLTSEGEVMLFSGTDPTSELEEEWKLEGVYQVPRPVGWRCVSRMGSDLIIATQGGYFLTSSVVGAVGQVDKAASLSDKIRGAIAGLKSYYDHIGWQVVFLQSVNYLIINIPLNDTTTQQFVLNMENQTWSRFTGVNATQFMSFGSDVYFGGKRGGIFKMFSGGDDYGLQIPASCQQAFSTFDNPKVKHVKTLTLMVGCGFTIPIKILLSADFNLQPACNVYPVGKSEESDSAMWNEATWNKDFWGVSTKAEDLDIQALTTFVSNNPSRYYSIGIQVAPAVSEDNDMVWYSTVYSYEQEM